MLIGPFCCEPCSDLDVRSGLVIPYHAALNLGLISLRYDTLSTLHGVWLCFQTLCAELGVARPAEFHCVLTSTTSRIPARPISTTSQKAPGCPAPLQAST